MSNYVSRDKKVEAAYRKLTGVDINEQYMTWDARGKGYCGEFEIFSELYTKIPGRCKILMNLQIPSSYGRTTEIDLLLIHETGLYVFEVKHYKGTIYGRMEDPRWTQYFRTEPNNPFQNPVLQNNWHIEQLQKLCPTLPIRSYIVFTSDEVDLRVTGSAAATLCYKHEACSLLLRGCGNAPQCLTPEQIDGVFNSLKDYSPMQAASVTYDGAKLSLYQFIEALGDLHSKKMQEAEQNYIDKEKTVMQKAKNLNVRVIAICAAAFLVFAMVCSASVKSNKEAKQAAIAKADAQVEKYKADAEAARTELQEFAKKWEVVTDFEIDGTKLKDDYVSVDNVTLVNSSDVGDVVKFSCVLTHNGEDFYVLIDKDSMLTIVLTDGRVIETPYYKYPYYSYSLGYSSNYKTLHIKNHEFAGFSAEEVAFIKMTNLQIKRITAIYGEKPVLTNYEIVLYNTQ